MDGSKSQAKRIVNLSVKNVELDLQSTSWLWSVFCQFMVTIVAIKIIETGKKVTAAE